MHLSARGSPVGPKNTIEVNLNGHAGVKQRVFYLRGDRDQWRCAEGRVGPVKQDRIQI